MRIVSILLGLLLGAALFATVMLLPQADMDAVVTSTGLANLLPLAAPPVSPTARLLIGAPGFVILAALGFILAPRPRIEDELGTATEPELVPEPLTVAPEAEPAPVAEAVLAEEPVPAPAPEPAFAAVPDAPLVAEPETRPEPGPGPVFVADKPGSAPLTPPAAPPDLVLREADLAEPLRPPLVLDEADRIDLHGTASAEPNPYAPFADRIEPAVMADEAHRPLMSAAPVPIEPAFSEPNRKAHAMTSREDVTPAADHSAAVDPAALAGLERRMEALDERLGGQLGQIAQQLAEIAQVTRMMARTPVAPAAPALHIARGTFAEGDARTRIAHAARALKASFAPLPALD